MPESYSGDEGDEALAAGLDVMDGGEVWGGIWGGFVAINKTRDMIARLVAGVTRAWTTATTAAAARVALGIPDISPGGTVVVNGLPTYDATGRMVTNTPATPGQVANKAYVDSVVPVIPPPDDTPIFTDVGVTGGFFTPNAFAATSSYTIAYINGDGRVSRGASAEKYKKLISAFDPANLGDLFSAPFTRYQMRSDGVAPADSTWRYGYIANQLVGTDMEPFVVIINDEIESIDFISLLLAQTAQLHARLAALEDRNEP